MDQEAVISEIKRLKKEKDITILAHNYQLPSVQDCADFTGDSLGLAQKAAGTKSRALLVCGVYFMAETAAILNPGKTVLIPDIHAGCPLAEFADAKMVEEWRKNYPDYTFVAYVNTSAEVKALSDVCCTSSNAVAIVKSINNDKIVFLPDKNLGAYVASQVPEKNIALWPGYCVVHETADLAALAETKAGHPSGLVMVHPECPKDFLELADGILSTGQMFRFVEQHPETREFIVVTEWGINYALQKRFPDRTFIEPARRMECRNMKKITPDKVLNSLKKMEYIVKVKPDTADKARVSIEKMLSMTV
jgi:quinolinate synthase